MTDKDELAALRKRVEELEAKAKPSEDGTAGAGYGTAT
jgi:hypothetical protein